MISVFFPMGNWHHTVGPWRWIPQDFSSIHDAMATGPFLPKGFSTITRFQPLLDQQPWSRRASRIGWIWMDDMDDMDHGAMPMFHGMVCSPVFGPYNLGSWQSYPAGSTHVIYIYILILYVGWSAHFWYCLRTCGGHLLGNWYRDTINSSTSSLDQHHHQPGSGWQPPGKKNI